MPDCCFAAAPLRMPPTYSSTPWCRTAYGTLLRVRHREMHARVAGVLEHHFADLVERQPELLAHHLTASGSTERAVDQWLKAGQHAAERSAHLEAIGHFEHGLETLAAVP